MFPAGSRNSWWCLLPCRPGVSLQAAKGSVRRVPAGWRRRLLVPRRRCYATVRQVPPKRAAGGVFGVFREANFVVFFGRDETTPTVSPAGP